MQTPATLLIRTFSLTGTQSDYEFYDIQSTWGDPIDWLNVQSNTGTGYVYGTVPQEFNHGGGQVRFWDPLQGESSIVHSNFFDINAPFRIEDGENGQIEIGDQWTNSRMQYNVFVNTQGDLNYMGQNIPPNTIKLSDGKFYSFDDFEQMRDGRGIEVAGSQFDDYIDLSGLSITDFNQMDWWHYTDFEISPWQRLLACAGIKSRWRICRTVRCP